MPFPLLIPAVHLIGHGLHMLFHAKVAAGVHSATTHALTTHALTTHAAGAHALTTHAAGAHSATAHFGNAAQQAATQGMNYDAAHIAAHISMNNPTDVQQIANHLKILFNLHDPSDAMANMQTIQQYLGLDNVPGNVSAEVLSKLTSPLQY
jgi:hypothetical protein